MSYITGMLNRTSYMGATQDCMYLTLGEHTCTRNELLNQSINHVQLQVLPDVGGQPVQVCLVSAGLVI